VAKSGSKINQKPVAGVPFLRRNQKLSLCK